MIEDHNQQEIAKRKNARVMRVAQAFNDRTTEK
jgi:hypothetical protein